VTDLSLGGVDDAVSVEVDGRVINIVESYEVKVSVMVQPAAFSLRLGWGDTAKALLDMCPLGAPFKLFVGDVLVQSGLIDSRSVPASDATVIELRGRDHMRALFNSHVKEETSFTERTYYDLTRKVMDICHLEDHELIAGNGANRQAVTAVPVPNVKTEDMTRTITTGLGPGGSHMEFKALKAKVGQRWYDWLCDKYKLVGLFLWCAGDGKFVLATPQPNVKPSTVLVRQRGVDRNTVNILSHAWRDDATNRHARYIVYGRSGGGKGGRSKISGEFYDDEMSDAGMRDVITFHEDEIDTVKDAEYLARKYAAEARRAGWELSYTVAGHRTPSTIDNGIAVWGPDTAAEVTDDELGINGPHYLESITYARSGSTTTKLELIRPSDLLYLAEKNPAEKAKSIKKYNAAVAKTAPVPEVAAPVETDWSQYSWKHDGTVDAPAAANTIPTADEWNS